nr:M13 family metallopeptidase [Candidatus Eremiobacteraeota bacterium]
GLGLPDRDYYLNDDAKTTSIRNAYVSHVQTMFQLLGDTSTTSAGEAQSVLQTETALAKVELSRVASRDPANVYHKMSFAQLQALAPNFNWQAYFAARGIPTTVTINVAQPNFFKGFSDLLGTIGEPSLQTYLRWHVAHAYANALSQPFVDANFAFFSHTLQGTPQQQPRWKTCVQATNSALGEALGQYYVEQTFPPAAKVQALAMVRNIKQTLRDDFSTLEWMSPQTRLRADQKLDAFLLKIGYPDRWQDYRALPISKQSYAGNEIVAAHYESSRAMARIGHPVDRALWGMTPPTVNAYYNPSVNEIVFPAGILQPPFYNKNADMAVNYGGIGAVIGHESTHGFDDEGRKFDLNGNLTDWWSAQDATRFSARAQCVVDQWNKLSPLPGVHENGQLVQGEEIADLGGLTIAYKAFEKWQSHHPRRTIDGFTPEQRFFMGWAQVWAGQDRPASIALRAKTDVHGYDKFRVNQTVANLPGFAQAFFCKLNDPMYLAPKDRCQIW